MVILDDVICCAAELYYVTLIGMFCPSHLYQFREDSHTNT